MMMMLMMIMIDQRYLYDFHFVFSQTPHTVVLTKDGAIPAPALGEPKPKQTPKKPPTQKTKTKNEIMNVFRNILVFVYCVPARKM